MTNNEAIREIIRQSLLDIIADLKADTPALNCFSVGPGDNNDLISITLNCSFCMAKRDAECERVRKIFEEFNGQG